MTPCPANFLRKLSFKTGQTARIKMMNSNSKPVPHNYVEVDNEEHDCKVTFGMKAEGGFVKQMMGTTPLIQSDDFAVIVCSKPNASCYGQQEDGSGTNVGDDFILNKAQVDILEFFQANSEEIRSSKYKDKINYYKLNLPHLDFAYSAILLGQLCESNSYYNCQEFANQFKNHPEFLLLNLQNKFKGNLHKKKKSTKKKLKKKSTKKKLKKKTAKKKLKKKTTKKKLKKKT